MMLRALSLSILACGSAFAFAACGTQRSDFDGPKPETFEPNGTDDAGDPTACIGTRCAPDLKSVLCRHGDGTESMLQTCAPGQGCGGDKCIDACASADFAKGSIGCAFATLPTDTTIQETDGACFAAFIANTWDQPAAIQATLGGDPIDLSQSIYYVERNGTALDYVRVNGPIDIGKVAVVFLSQSMEQSQYRKMCPSTVVPALREDPIAHGTSRTRAFILTSSVPVSAYSIYPYGGATSFSPTATLLLPISSWETNYVAVNGWPEPGLTSSAPTIQIVASEDDTVVRIRPKVDIVGGGGIDSVGHGQVQSWNLARGEVLQITQPKELIGSPIEASKPVGLFGGAQCPNIPSNVDACDALQQQIAPVSQWGSDYALVPNRPRAGAGNTQTDLREQVPWRFVGAIDGTKLTYDPSPPPFGAPETLEAGQSVIFTTSYVGTVRSQDSAHPFHAALFMTGAATVTTRLGDPDFVTDVPNDQFLDHYIFFTDFTYRDTTLTFVRRKTPEGFMPITLDCAGEVPDFKPIGKSGEYEFAWLRLTANGDAQTFPGGTCDYGRHEAKSDGPFGLYVWGTDSWASYGYPGGTGSRPLSDVKGPPIN